jgi:hypothetical protein
MRQQQQKRDVRLRATIQILANQAVIGPIINPPQHVSGNMINQNSRDDLPCCLVALFSLFSSAELSCTHKHGDAADTKRRWEQPLTRAPGGSIRNGPVPWWMGAINHNPQFRGGSAQSGPLCTAAATSTKCGSKQQGESWQQSSYAVIHEQQAMPAKKNSGMVWSFGCGH